MNYFYHLLSAYIITEQTDMLDMAFDELEEYFDD